MLGILVRLAHPRQYLIKTDDMLAMMDFISRAKPHEHQRISSYSEAQFIWTQFT
jgi:hypothetical protein